MVAHKPKKFDLQSSNIEMDCDESSQNDQIQKLNQSHLQTQRFKK